jgi:hemolysin activation/secretion protein
VFFAGLFVAANIADPDFLGSRWNAGANLNGRFFAANDEITRDGEVVPEETVEQRAGSFNLFAGRPLGDFFSLELTYRARYESYERADDTADDFTLPVNTMTHGFEASLDYNRAGYRVSLAGEVDRRSKWEFWGLPDNTDYDDEQREYQRWKLSVAKTWWLPKFHKIGLVLEHLDSANTDRFSGYDFGLFGDTTVAGYPIGLVRAEQATGAHLTGGINIFELIRFTVSADAMWATNEATGLDNELLAGVGVGGTLTLPWQLVMNFDVGYALTGPGEGGVALRVFLLKLFPKS